MVLRCHALRKVPLSSLSAGDVRVLLGQEVGTRFLLPIALELLELNPLIEGDYYAGDLLANVLRLHTLSWKGDGNSLERASAVARRAVAELSASEESLQSNRALLKEINAFLQRADA
jgi:hypothetical protein